MPGCEKNFENILSPNQRWLNQEKNFKVSNSETTE